jgi:hypothetical protein
VMQPVREKPREDYTELHKQWKIAKPVPRGKPQWK